MVRHIARILPSILLLFFITTLVYSDDATDKLLRTQMLLGELGYGIGPYDGVLDGKTEKAVREYQQLRNLPVTGDPLSVETLNQVEKDLELLNSRPVPLPKDLVLLELWQRGYVSAVGTWTFSDERLDRPNQTTRIQCYRDRRLCIEATAIVSGRGILRSLSVNTDEYEIERWDDNEIVTKPRQFGFCIQYVRRFNRSQESVTGLRSPTPQYKSATTVGLCKDIENEEMHMTLGDGSKVWVKLYEERRKAAKGLFRFTPEMLKYLDKQQSK